MGISIERGNMTSVGQMVAQLCRDLQANGFKALHLNGAPVPSGTAPTFDDSITKVLFAATDAVDPLAVEDNDTTHANYDKRQPWRFAIEVDQEAQAVRWFFCTPTNIKMEGSKFDISISRFTKATSGAGNADTICKSGMLQTDSRVQSDENPAVQWDKREKPTGSLTGFYSKEKFSFSYAHFGFDVKQIDRQSIPITYRLAITDHGIALCAWVEAHDNLGDKFTWFNVQRMVDKDTGETIVDGKSPLFCVFSMLGGGGSTINTVDPHGVYYFVVRESDVNSPTFPVSANVDTADSWRIINTVQQLSISEDNKLILSMMKGMNTQRYSYDHELDMMGYISADVISQYQDVEITQYNEAEPRIFKAMKANYAHNTGMRILMIQKGAGIA
ncbi:MAG: hypothetical protein ACRC6V_03630 [Bacteroidales bacterium]